MGRHCVSLTGLSHGRGAAAVMARARNKREKNVTHERLIPKTVHLYVKNFGREGGDGRHGGGKEMMDAPDERGGLNGSHKARLPGHGSHPNAREIRNLEIACFFYYRHQ